MHVWYSMFITSVVCIKVQLALLHSLGMQTPAAEKSYERQTSQKSSWYWPLAACSMQIKMKAWKAQNESPEGWNKQNTKWKPYRLKSPTSIMKSLQCNIWYSFWNIKTYFHSWCWQMMPQQCETLFFPHRVPCPMQANVSTHFWPFWPLVVQEPVAQKTSKALCVLGWPPHSLGLEGPTLCDSPQVLAYDFICTLVLLFDFTSTLVLSFW